MSTPRHRLRERWLDPRNRRSTNIEDRRASKDPSIPSPVDSAGYPFGHHITGDKPDISNPVPHGAPAFDNQNILAANRARIARMPEYAPERPPRRKVKFPNPSKPK